MIGNDESEQLYKPDEIVPTSGGQEVINPHKGSAGREITSSNGEHFQPTLESGTRYMLVDETKQLYKPGEIVPTSGQYSVINPDGSSLGREVTATKGEHFPPTPESGMRYKLVDPTQQKT